jgi:ABC-2 type transport system permease protein
LVLTLAIKDLKRASRSFFLLGMALGAPLAISAIIAFSFSVAEPDTFEPVKTAVADERTQLPTSGADPILGVLEHESMARLLELRRVEGADEARRLVLEEEVEAGVVVRDAAAGSALPRLELLQDPAATLRPRIVAAILDRTLDVSAGAGIATAHLSADARGAALGAYYAWLGSAATSGPTTPGVVRGPAGSGLVVVPPDPEKQREGGSIERVRARVLLAQLVFFAFFTAAFGAQTLLREEEEGTLARLRTLPVRLSTMLAGKALFLAVLVALQATVLLLINRFAFGVDVGSLPSAATAITGLVFSTAGLGLLLNSLATNVRQGGGLIGGGLTVLGGIGGLFTVGFPALPEAMRIAALVVPQGWAFRGFDLALSHASLGASLTSMAAAMAFGLACAGLGLWRLSRRLSPRAGGTS